LKGNQIEKTVTLSDFAGEGFVTTVALIAERRDHHPDITIRWNTVTLTVSTHSAGGLTAHDFELAREIDGL
jgi:4a-hydroxytetrahydrobiopterin dehydratase